MVIRLKKKQDKAKATSKFFGEGQSWQCHQYTLHIAAK